LKKIRKEKGISQGEMAEMLHVSQACYCRYENGQRALSVPVAKEIAKILDVDWTLFYEESK
jgi:transcriptional regulator with XRE-family HTH domain